jgi:hypothetical protein
MPVAAGGTPTAVTSTVDMDLYEAASTPPFNCMYVTSMSNMEKACLGCIGAKGGKFCTRRKQESDELGTCGVNSHTKKAVVKADHNYFAESAKQVAYTEPALNINYDLASCVLGMRSEPLIRVQFRELVQMITSQLVTTKEEL